MTTPNTLIFVDFPSPDPAAAAHFYEAVFGWKIEGRPEGVFHRIVPGGEFPLPDGTNSGVGNLHLGIYETRSALPDPTPEPAGGTGRPEGPVPRVYILVSPDDSEDRILDKKSSAPRFSGVAGTGPSSTASTRRSATRGARRSSCGPSATTRRSRKAAVSTTRSASAE